MKATEDQNIKRADTDFYPSHPEWTFNFRGRSPGQNGGAIVTVCTGPGRGILSSGVSICTPADQWEKSKGIKIASARMNCPGSHERPNPWRFMTKFNPLHILDQRIVYDFARHSLRKVFILHDFSSSTKNWFEKQLPWTVFDYLKGMESIYRG